MKEKEKYFSNLPKDIFLCAEYKIVENPLSPLNPQKNTDK
jgi:hypothetical protein